MRAPWGNVSHSARGGVDNHHDDPADHAQAHHRRRPRHHPVLRNGWWRGLRLTITNSTSTTLARLRYAIAIPTSIGVRPRFRFAPSNTPCQCVRPRRSQRARLTPVTLAASARPSSNVPPLRDHQRPARNQRPQNHERPQSRYVRARLRCSSRASLPLTPRLARLLQQLECALPLRFGEDKVTH